ncbi:MAG: hypothetical protein AAF368_06250, partial [Planctomycetota bacterium]
FQFFRLDLEFRRAAPRLVHLDPRLSRSFELCESVSCVGFCEFHATLDFFGSSLGVLQRESRRALDLGRLQLGVPQGIFGNFRLCLRSLCVAGELDDLEPLALHELSSIFGGLSAFLCLGSELRRSVYFNRRPLLREFRTPFCLDGSPPTRLERRLLRLFLGCTHVANFCGCRFGDTMVRSAASYLGSESRGESSIGGGIGAPRQPTMSLDHSEPMGCQRERFRRRLFGAKSTIETLCHRKLSRFQLFDHCFCRSSLFEVSTSQRLRCVVRSDGRGSRRLEPCESCKVGFYALFCFLHRSL